MKRKNKVMLAAAIGAVVVLVASSLVQCALVRSASNQEQAASSKAQSASSSLAAAEENPSENSLQEPSAQASRQEEHAASKAGERSNSSTAEMFALDALRSHAWQAEGDAGTTIAFKDGTFVETDTEGVKVTAFEITDVAEGDGQGTIAMKLVRDGFGEELDTVVLVEGKEGELRITSDGFRNASAYVQAGAGEEPVGVSGVTEPYTGLIDNRTDELASAVAAYCHDHVPTATEASFDGEVFLDVREGRVVATFHCDDVAKTILSVTYADGAFSVLG